MEKEDGIVLSQLIGSMKELVVKLKHFYDKGDEIALSSVKSEIIVLQKKINSLVK